MSRIAIIGSGYVGLTTGACFAGLGHDVTCVDIDADRIAALSEGRVPFYEPGLVDLVKRGLAAGRLRFTQHHADAVQGAAFVFIAVNTPSAPDGSADLQYLRAALADTAAAITRGEPPIIVLKSTAPIGTAEAVALHLRRTIGQDVPVVTNPEFLREGSAVADALAPDRVVVGGVDDRAVAAVAALYGFAGCPVVRCDWRSAEMIKYAANAYLAARISFINEMAAIADVVGADIGCVAEGIGLDRRIGTAYLRPGLGFGGSCLPKDVRALAHMGATLGARTSMLQAVMEVNADQPRLLTARLSEALDGLDGRVIALLGLAFKPDTDDLREAPSLELIPLLRAEGAVLRVYDPAAAAPVIAEAPDLMAAASPYEAGRGADAVVLVTEWDACVRLDFARLAHVMRGDLIADGRNAWDAAAARAAGLRYVAVGVPDHPIPQALPLAGPHPPAPSPKIGRGGASRPSPFREGAGGDVTFLPPIPAERIASPPLPELGEGARG
jgi:UDPglucose 6-dehydrogenase